MSSFRLSSLLIVSLILHSLYCVGAFTQVCSTSKTFFYRPNGAVTIENRFHHVLSAAASSPSSDVAAIKPNGDTNQVSFPIQKKKIVPYPPFRAALTKAGMMAFIVGMCIALPLTLIPQWIAYKLGLISRIQKERSALLTSQFCARWMLRLFPFMNLAAFPYHDPNPPASIWVCNHSSMLDVFVLLAVDKRLRGPTRRPIKIVYWKQLEDNPVTALLFKQAGFISVQMAANKAGEANDYDKSSFRQLLKDSKQAFEEGFDLGILPEGQLNPHPEAGLMPIFSGAFSLARMSRRPIQMIAMHGPHRLWHPVDGMRVCGRTVKVRVYPTAFRFDKGEDFMDTFKAVVGEFATTGQDLPREDLDAWLSGKKIFTRNLEKTKRSVE